MQNKFIADILKVADVHEDNISSNVFIFFTTSCQSDYTDNSELGEDLVSISTIEETLQTESKFIKGFSEEDLQQIKDVIQELKTNECGYLRIVD